MTGAMESTDAIGPAGAKPPLLRLPLEIINVIAVEYLSPSDYKSLRLVSRSLGPAMIALLFRRVYLSKTKLDRDNFFSISEHPHLAVAVRELVWYELTQDETVFAVLDPEWRAKSLDDRDAEPLDTEGDADGPFGIPDFMALARDAFWWPSRSSTGAYQDQYPKEEAEKSYNTVDPQIVADFQSRFLPSLAAMPGLHTFVSCPMPPLRPIPTNDYTLTAQMFQKEGGWEMFDASDGFIRFMRLAMLRPELSIQRLAVTDEFMGTCMARLEPEDTLSFQGLTHISLCLGRSIFKGLENLNSCLRAATGLVELRVCLEQCRNEEGWSKPLRNGWPATGLFAHSETRPWPSLRTLELTEVYVDEPDPGESLVGLVKAHGATLRRLVLRQCSVTRAFLEAVAAVPNLQLTTLEIQEDKTGGRVVPEADLLAYVNGKGPLPANPRHNGSWETVSTKFDPEIAPTEALFDVSMSHDEFYTDGELGVIADSLHLSAPPLLRSGLGLYTREIRAREARGPAGSHPLSSGSRGFLTETIPIPTSIWHFRHPDGSEAVGDEPLQFWSDWEDSADDTSDEEGGGLLDEEGRAKRAATYSRVTYDYAAAGGSEATSDGESSNFHSSDLTDG